MWQPARGQQDGATRDMACRGDAMRAEENHLRLPLRMAAAEMIQEESALRPVQ